MNDKKQFDFWKTFLIGDYFQIFLNNNDTVRYQ